MTKDIEDIDMLGLALLVVIVIAWFVLNRYVFPRLGIRT